MSKREPKWYQEEKEIEKMAHAYANLKTVDDALAWWPAKLTVETKKRPSRDEKREQERLLRLLFENHDKAYGEGMELARKEFVLKRIRRAAMTAFPARKTKA